ncbi:MAG: Gfo/Idh/MocA family oxidoreductase [Verrucomicrobia bacterium]|nr:Gfo/Idh/MocA family oxidoreductase [Verrucomicrobiota bacterium]MBU1910132.1 Gfo/Idh/MocA family oxidoreductase [Verrucomicrobiota bacterium]
MQLGVVGLGYWGPNLVRNALENPRYEDVWVWDRDPQRVQLIRRQYRAVRVASDFDEMLRNDAINAIAVATPVSTHFELGCSVLNAGKALLMEKPFTATVREARALRDLAEKKNGKLLIDHTFIYTSAVQKIKELRRKGDLGEIYYYDSVRVNLGLFQHDANVISDLAPHDLAIMDYLLEQSPTSISAVGVAHIDRRFENIAYLHLDFDNGLVAHFHLNWLSPVKIRQTLIGGSKKMLVYDDMEASDKIKVYDKGVQITRKDDVYKTLIQYRSGDLCVPQIRNVEALKVMMEHFADCVEKDAAPITDAASGIRVMQMLEAAQKSLKLGGKKIPLTYE